LILSLNTFSEQKASKLRIQKEIWQSKLQTFFAIGICFASSKDELIMCKISILSSHALPGKNVDFAKKAVFGAKNIEIRHSKTALAAKVASFFKWIVVFPRQSTL
jgi:hypothetical protein